MRFDDPGLVREQYASEAGLRARQALYRTREGPDAREVAFETVAALRPRRVLEVGGGPGEVSERIMRELGCEVAFVDISPRMVELARERGLDAELGDVQALRFADASFDCAVAAWMLYHVPDLDRGVSELARVLEPGGALVAVTNSDDHLRELRDLLPGGRPPMSFSRENGEEVLRRHFADVERRDVDAWTTAQTREMVRDYVASMASITGSPDALASFETPLRIRTAVSIFVARKA